MGAWGNLVMGAGVIAALSLSACVAEPIDCPVGSRGCSCTAGGACDPALTCVDSFCRPPPCACDEGPGCSSRCDCDTGCISPGSDAGPAMVDSGQRPSIETCAPSVDGCWQSCITSSTSTSSCRGTCGRASECGEVSCAALCIENDDSTSACRGTCGLSSARGAFGCYAVCIANGDSTSSCRGTCSGGSECADRGCYAACTANGDSTSSCAGTCGLATDCARVGCYEACRMRGDSASSCRGTCGFSDGTCSECGDVVSVSDACFAACAARGESASSCASICR